MDKKNAKMFASIKAISKGEFTLTGMNKFKVVTNRWKQTKKILDPIEGGNRQNRLHLESRAPCWAVLWTLSYMPSIHENNILMPTGKPGCHPPRTPTDGRATGLICRLSAT